MVSGIHLRSVHGGVAVQHAEKVEKVVGVRLQLEASALDHTVEEIAKDNQEDQPGDHAHCDGKMKGVAG